MNKIEIDLDALTAHMDELKDTRARLKFELTNIEKEIEKEELKFIALLDNTGVETMDYGVYTFGWKISTRKTFDQKLFGEKHPDLYEQFKIEKEQKNLSLFQKKKLLKMSMICQLTNTKKWLLKKRNMKIQKLF